MNSFFQLISDPSEKVVLLKDLVLLQADILVKSTEKDSVVAIAKAVATKGSELTVRLESPLPGVSGSADLMAQFSVGLQKFIAQVPARREGEHWLLEFSGKLFRVQRRELYRLKLPPGYRGKLFIPKLMGSEFNQEFHLVDISGGGCKIELPDLDFKFPTEEEFNAVLKIPNRKEISLFCRVRYQSRAPHRPGTRWVGIEFVRQTEPQRNSLAALVMDLYRETFSKRS